MRKVTYTKEQIISVLGYALAEVPDRHHIKYSITEEGRVALEELTLYFYDKKGTETRVSGD